MVSGKEGEATALTDIAINTIRDCHLMAVILMLPHVIVNIKLQLFV